MTRRCNILKDESGFAGLIIIILVGILAYLFLHTILLFMPEPILSKHEVVYAETSSKIYPDYKDVLFEDFKEVDEIPFEELIVTIVPKDRFKNYDLEGTIGIYPVSDISSETISSLGLLDLLKDKYQSVALKDLTLVLLSEETLVESSQWKLQQ